MQAGLRHGRQLQQALTTPATSQAKPITSPTSFGLVRAAFLQHAPTVATDARCTS
jgi:hypothetical protein